MIWCFWKNTFFSFLNIFGSSLLVIFVIIILIDIFSIFAFRFACYSKNFVGVDQKNEYLIFYLFFV